MIKRRKQGEYAELVGIMTVAHSGDAKAIKDAIKKLSEESR